MNAACSVPYLTSMGIVIMALTGIISAATDQRGRRAKALLIVLYLFGAAIGAWGATQQSDRIAELRSSLESVVRVTVGELGALDKLSGGKSYYVRIAADADPARLRPYLERMLKQFPGAEASKMIAIRGPVAGSKLHVLVFGQHLTLTAAEVYQRLATLHRFPPPGQAAAIVPEE